MNWLSRKCRTLLNKYQSRYGKYLGLSIAVVVIASLPLPVPEVGFGTQALGEVLRLCGVRF